MNSTPPRSTSACSPAPREVAEALRAQLRHAQQRRGEQHRHRTDGAGADGLISSGCGALDRLLPAGGFTRGTLVEWLAEAGAGGGLLALQVARQAAARGGVVVILDDQGTFYPPAAAALGLDLQRTLILRPQRPADALWAVDQVLRAAGVAALWAPLPRLEARDFRRLQLAAEEGGVLGLLLRPPHLQGQPSWSDVQLRVRPRTATAPPPPTAESWWLRIEVVRCRGGTSGQAVDLAIDEHSGQLISLETPSLETPGSRDHHAPHSLSPLSRLAAAAPLRRAARA